MKRLLRSPATPPRCGGVVLIVFCLMAITATAAGQDVHGGQYAQIDIQYGASIYAQQCVRCHGPNGDGIPGIEFRTGVFTRVATDDDIRSIVTNGIPGTGMPAFPFNASEVTGVVAYLRNMDAIDTSTVKLGDAASGGRLFRGKGSCLSCHRVDGHGSRLGPNLSEIGVLRPASFLERSLLDPGGTMLPVNRSIRAVTRDGRTVTGRRINEDTHTVQIVDRSETLVSLSKVALAEYEVLTTSAMPSYKETLTAPELADLLAYLLTLKGQTR